ncbi:MAG: SIR2 family protein [Planctomycetes bacterium]|nr:SIR2 family protein [Planctomycetota bacterium]
MPTTEAVPTGLGWSEDTWGSLLRAIKAKKCTPFIGAGACVPFLPTGRKIAQQWADEEGYPFDDKTNLVRVAQYLAVKCGAMDPKLRIKEIFDTFKQRPDFSSPCQAHSLLADLNLPVYITTNYDDYMFEALRQRNRKPRRDVCRWRVDRQRDAQPATPMPEPTVDEPLVFHLHGVLDDDQSMVLTEDDYLEFLMNVSADPARIPPRIERAFTESKLLFMGYSLDDMNFKVLFRKLALYMQRSGGARHIAVQLAPTPGDSAQESIARAERQSLYLRDQLKQKDVEVYWSTCEQFAKELRTRWEAVKNG